MAVKISKPETRRVGKRGIRVTVTLEGTAQETTIEATSFDHTRPKKKEEVWAVYLVDKHYSYNGPFAFRAKNIIRPGMTFEHALRIATRYAEEGA
jgi:hypothetical protein